MRSPRVPVVLTAVLAAAALVAIVSLGGPLAWIPAHYVAKPLATTTLLVLAATAASPIAKPYQRLLVAGLVFSLAGDVLLMLPADLFAFGLAAFLIAHLCYLAAFLSQSRFLSKPVALIGYAMVAGTLLFALYGGLPTSLRIPVIAYVVVITLMAAQSAMWMLESRSDAARRAAVGAAWFLVSDATLAIARFRAAVPFRDLVVLGTYYVAQWYLARSVAGAERAPRAGDGA